MQGMMGHCSGLLLHRIGLSGLLPLRVLQAVSCVLWLNVVLLLASIVLGSRTWVGTCQGNTVLLLCIITCGCWAKQCCLMALLWDVLPWKSTAGIIVCCLFLPLYQLCIHWPQYIRRCNKQ